MHEPASAKEILEFIFACKRRDELLLDYLQREAWTPAIGSMIVCGIRPPPGKCNTIPDTAFGIDGLELANHSTRLKNARNLLANWREEYEDNDYPHRGEVPPHAFIEWCVDSGYITDWVRLIGSLYEENIEPQISIAHGGISDIERLTILPRSLMSALIETAQSPPVLKHSLREAVAPSEAMSIASPPSNPKPDQGTKNHKRVLSKKKPITRVIELAIENAKDPNNTESIWLALVQLAKSTPRPEPLIGYVHGEGIKWINEEKSDDDVQYLTKSLFERRLETNLGFTIAKKATKGD